MKLLKGNLTKNHSQPTKLNLQMFANRPIFNAMFGSLILMMINVVCIADTIYVYTVDLLRIHSERSINLTLYDLT